MSKRMAKKLKPTIVRVGKHYINPLDVSCIRAVTIRKEVPDFDNEEEGSRTTVRTLYVVDRISCPRPEHTIWIKEKDINILLEQFNIIEK